ncbi:MAG: acyltransferase [Candidatus Aminicenantes bacterium]|nr:acyltransferase [Candidatus Aminicenantes bacterium]
MAKDVYGSIQKELGDGRKSLGSKYRDIFVGRRGFSALLKYELLTCLSAIPGAFGYTLRKAFYPSLLGQVGKGVVFGRYLTFRHPHKIRIGAGTVIDDYAVLDAKGEENDGIRVGEQAYIGRNAILSCKEGAIRLGDHSNISANCTLLSETEIVLGQYCFLAGNCYLVAGGNHSFVDVTMPIMLQPSLAKGGIRVGDDVWLGAGVIVLDGVSIGSHSVIGAGSVVSAALPEYSFARGARSIKIQDRRNEPQNEKKT